MGTGPEVGLLRQPGRLHHAVHFPVVHLAQVLRLHHGGNPCPRFRVAVQPGRLVVLPFHAGHVVAAVQVDGQRSRPVRLRDVREVLDDCQQAQGAIVLGDGRAVSVVDQHDLLVLIGAVVLTGQVGDELVGLGRLQGGLQAQGGRLAGLGVGDDPGAVLPAEDQGRGIVEGGHWEGVQALGALIGHVIDDDGAGRLAGRRDLVQALGELPPNVEGEGLGWVHELVGGLQGLGVGGEFVVVEGVVDDVVVVVGRLRVGSCGNDDDLVLDGIRRVVVIVVNHLTG